MRPNWERSKMPIVKEVLKSETPTIRAEVWDPSHCRSPLDNHRSQ